MMICSINFFIFIFFNSFFSAGPIESTIVSCFDDVHILTDDVDVHVDVGARFRSPICSCEDIYSA